MFLSTWLKSGDKAAGNWIKEQAGILILKQNGGKEEMSESKVIPKKRKGRKKKVIAVSLVGVLAAGGIGGALYYKQKWNAYYIGRNISDIVDMTKYGLKVSAGFKWKNICSDPIR